MNTGLLQRFLPADPAKRREWSNCHPISAGLGFALAMTVTGLPILGAIGVAAASLAVFGIACAIYFTLAFLTMAVGIVAQRPRRTRLNLPK